MSSSQRATVTYIPQILFSGNSGVGKTTLIGTVTGFNIDPTSSKPTLGYDFIEKKLVIGTPPREETIKVRYYDQQFDMNQSPPSILRGRDIVVLVWSLTDPESYRNLGSHIDTIENICDSHNPHPPAIILCANKCDLCTKDTEFNLCREQYKYPLVKTSFDRDGIPELQSHFSKILFERYKVFSDKKFDSLSTSIAPVLQDDRPEPRCCKFT